MIQKQQRLLLILFAIGNRKSYFIQNKCKQQFTKIAYFSTKNENNNKPYVPSNELENLLFQVRSNPTPKLINELNVKFLESKIYVLGTLSENNETVLLTSEIATNDNNAQVLFPYTSLNAIAHADSVGRLRKKEHVIFDKTLDFLNMLLDAPPNSTNGSSSNNNKFMIALNAECDSIFFVFSSKTRRN